MTSDAVVFVVDDDAAVRESLAMLLRLAGYGVHDYDSAARFLSEARPVPRSCLIADIRMPDMDGLELQQELLRRGSPLPVIIVTGHGDVPLAVQAMKAGAVDFLEKPFAREVLLAAVRRALDRTAQPGVSDIAQDEIGRRLGLLTGREREVYDFVVAGKQSKVIAHELGTSPRTIEIHRARMMQKMQAKTLQDLVRMAIAMGRPARG
jgi:two-component system, LuxR family, response regulator FixJ